MSLLRKAILLNSAEFLCLILGAGQSILVARFLGPAGVGQYVLVLAAMRVAAQLSSLGLPLSFLYHSQRDPEHTTTYLMNVVWSVAVLSSLGGFSLVFVVGLFDGYFGRIPWYALLGIGLYLPFVLGRVVASNVLLIRIEARRLSLMRIVSAAANVLAILVMYMLASLHVPQAILCYVLAACVGMILGWRWAGSRLDFSIRPAWNRCRRLVLMGIRQSWVDLMLVVNIQVSLVAIKYLVDDFESVGYFSRGERVAGLVLVGGTAIMPLLFSRWASLPEDKIAAHVEKVMRLASVGGLVTVVGVLLTGNWIILIMYGSAFLPAVQPMTVLVPAAVLFLLSRTFIQLLGSRGSPELSVLSLFACAVTNAVLCLLLVPSMGITGAAWASLLSNLILLSLILVIVKWKYDIRVLQCCGIRRNDIQSIMEAILRRKMKHVS